MFQNLTGVFVGSSIWHFDSVVASNYALRTVCPKTVCTQLLRKAMFGGPYGVSPPDNWIPRPLTGILYCFVLSTPISGAESPWNKRNSAISSKTGMPRLKQKVDQYLKANLTPRPCLVFSLADNLGDTGEIYTWQNGCGHWHSLELAFAKMQHDLPSYVSWRGRENF